MIYRCIAETQRIWVAAFVSVDGAVEPIGLIPHVHVPVWTCVANLLRFQHVECVKYILK